MSGTFATALSVLLVTVGMTLTGCGSGAAPASDESAKSLTAIKDDWWAWFQRENPETATSLGEYKYNDKLTDYSLSHVQNLKADTANFLTRLKGINRDALTEADQLDLDLLLRTVEDNATGLDLQTYLMPVDQMNGIQIGLPQIPTFAPFDTVKHYEDYIARLNQVPTALEQATGLMKEGLARTLAPPAYLLTKTIPQCASIADAAGASNAFATPLKKMPDSFSAADKQRLRVAIISAVDQKIRPAYRTFQQFIAKDYAPFGRKEPGIWSLPNGDQRYLYAIRAWTSSKKTPEEIHQLGLQQVNDIEAQINDLAHKAAFSSGKEFRTKTLADPKYKATSREQILNVYRGYIDGMRPKLPELFTRLPKAQVTVTSVPAFMEKDGSTQYINGTPDGSRAGQVWVDTYDPTHHNMLEDEATAYHEGIPGHHMQVSIAQELPTHPFHHALFFSSYIEGWALYAERLGKDIGFYKDPASDLGRLQSEMFRAVRLVVDTGVHYKHWTRDDMVKFFEAHYGDAPQSEVDRYIAWPAQALGYKLGQLEILDLRERAQSALGEKFDIKKFHDEVLGAGAMPLDLLESRMVRWTARQKIGG
jgi:uncharacterized protein (DUF885 family)